MTSQETQHHPKYFYCPDPETCCGDWWPIFVQCAVCLQQWPCETKRSHHTEAEVARLRRWAESRRGRPPRTPPRRAETR
jgi:hypothetical protein